MNRKMALVLDVSSSMAPHLPRVIAEVDKVAKDSVVVLFVGCGLEPPQRINTRTILLGRRARPLNKVLPLKIRHSRRSTAAPRSSRKTRNTKVGRRPSNWMRVRLVVQLKSMQDNGEGYCCPVSLQRL